MQYTLILLSIFLLVYVIYSVKDGIPPSLSSTYYSFEKYGWLFQLLMITLGFCLFPILIEFSPDNLDFLCFLSCGSLLFVGASPLSRLQFEGKVHTYSAVIGSISIVLWQVLLGMWDWILISLIICFIGYLFHRKHIWWLECAIIISLFGNLWKLLI